MAVGLNWGWGWVLIRLAIFFPILSLLFLSQRFWYRGAWRLTARIENSHLRRALRGVCVAAIIAVIVAAFDGMQDNHGHIIPRGSMITALAGLWFASALFAYIAVKTVHSFEWLWLQGKKLRSSAEPAPRPAKTPWQHGELVSPPQVTQPSNREFLENPSRRYFFQTATAVAGALPFLGALYGFAAERLHYVIHEVQVPIANLPPALEGLRIAQISDIHMSGYMTREQVRRAVDMVNELAPDLAVVTGDFITGAGDSLVDCVAEITRIRAQLGTWGCNGNHEIYAGFEDLAQELFARSGMRLLREENAQLNWRGAAFNIIGVDYQRQRTAEGQPFRMLQNVQPLVRRDMPNILLSHNPNAFPRAAQIGIELTLAGHTHGGQVQVEILDHSFSPARFITDFTAGLYHRPLAKTSSPSSLGASSVSHPRPAAAALYVNRGLGTVGAPIRIGVPPEITLLILKRA
ncbi:MAG TPA: metallophosphoesterase [Candidatus Dormibacteraeota bacterium]|nr:metallophosphoesterase [Candidatus Dormibacteraeota bacterium]